VSSTDFRTINSWFNLPKLHLKGFLCRSPEGFEELAGNASELHWRSPIKDADVSKNMGWAPKNGWFTMENLIKMDDLGGPTPIFLETPMWTQMVT